ncbi:MAG: DUF72 domain-containing protein [Candidatus Nitrosotenuis sp.]
MGNYTSIFDVNEVNSTFYPIPNDMIVKKWHFETQNHFSSHPSFHKL